MEYMQLADMMVAIILKAVKGSLMSRYDASKNAWTETASMSFSRCMMSAISDNKNIYVLGGYNGNEIKTVEKFDTNKCTWSGISQMICDRFMHCAIIIRTQCKEKLLENI